MNLTKEFELAISQSKSLDELTKALDALLCGGYSVWEDGSLYHIRQLVTKINGLRIEIFAKEHAPPHFHVSGGDIDASFSIKDCSLLIGHIGGRERKLVNWWHQRSKEILVRIWDETRPFDCPVGIIK